MNMDARISERLRADPALTAACLAVPCDGRERFIPAGVRASA